MKTFKQALAFVTVLSAISGLAQAGEAPEQTPAIMQLPAIACAGPLSKIKADYKAYYDSRIDVAKHFVGDQLSALEKLRDKMKVQIPAIRALMSQAADGKPESRKVAMTAVNKYLGDTLENARTSFWDFSETTCSWSGGCNTKWEERLDPQIMLSNGHYAVSACSHSTSIYNDDLKPMPSDLVMCAVLDLETGAIWGQTPLEALRLAGNKMDWNDYLLGAVTSSYPMCATAAGFALADMATVSESSGGKDFDMQHYLDGSSWNDGSALKSVISVSAH